MALDKISRVCKNCGQISDNMASIENINVSHNQELKDMVKNGSAFIWECPNCNSRSLIDETKFYLDADNKLLIWINSKDNLLDEQKRNSIESQLSDYNLRIVSSIGELIEKVNIFDAGLDDIAIEVCKYVTKAELSDNIKDENLSISILNSKLRFYRLNGADNEIIFAFADSKGEMKTINIGLNVYEDARQIIKRNPQLSQNNNFTIIDEEWVKTIFG